MLKGEHQECGGGELDMGDIGSQWSFSDCAETTFNIVNHWRPALRWSEGLDDVIDWRVRKTRSSDEGCLAGPRDSAT